MDPDDRNLVDAARKGDASAFRALVERYQQRVYAMSLSVLKDPSEARDAVQDTFVKVFQHLGDFQGQSSFYSWMYRIGMNVCIDKTRRSKRAVNVEYDEAVATPGDDAFGVAPHRLGFDPARALTDKEIRERVTKALAELSEAHRTVLVLREVDGLSYQEIADVVGCAVGTVMSRLFHARKRMQEMLRPLVDGDTAAVAGKPEGRAG